MHLQKIILLPLSLIGMLATFLPWMIIPGLPSADGTGGAGWITMGIYFVILIVILAGHLKRKLSWFSLICISMLSVLSSVYGLILSDQQSFGDPNKMNPTASTGTGLYVLIAVGFLIPILGFILRGPAPVSVKQESPTINVTVTEDKKIPG